MKKVISTTNAPAAIGPYSQAIEANGFVFASGQIPVNRRQVRSRRDRGSGRAGHEKCRRIFSRQQGHLLTRVVKQAYSSKHG